MRAVVTLFLLTTLLGTAVGGFYCPTGWTMHGKLCFLVSSEQQRSWYQAYDTCSSLNASLARFTSVEENDAIVFTGSSAWIGLHSPEPASPFVWADGSPSKGGFLNWARDQPSSGALNCVYLVRTYGSSPPSGWGDYFCRMKYSFICQKSKGRSQCDDDWVSHGGRCYRYNSTDTRDWFDARAFCQHLGGDLTVIDNADDNRFLTGIVRQNIKAWIGLWDQHMDYRWRWLDKPGEPTWSGWVPGQPENTKKGLDKHCACALGYYSRRASWRTEPCISNYKFICEGQSKNESCPPQWKSRSADGVKHCYYISTELTTWDKARAKCGLLTSGADLVKIQTSQETYFLKSYLSGSNREVCYWIGLSDLAHYSRWAWLDESAPVSSSRRYTYWYSTPSSSSQNSQDCILVYATSRELGKWANVKCHSVQGYICEMSGVTCANDTVRHGDHCYKVVESPKSWLSARRSCDLAIIETQEEMEFLKALISGRTDRVTGYWIRLSASETTGTDPPGSDTTKLTYSNWMKGQANHRPGEDCVYKSGKTWYDGDCLNSYSFICQRPVVGRYSYYDFAIGETVFKVVTDHRMPRQTNFTELCSNILGSGADLAVIDSQEELRVLSDELSYRGVAGSMWLDVSDKVNQAKPEPGYCSCIYSPYPEYPQVGSDFCCQLKPFICKRHLEKTKQPFDLVFNTTVYKFVTSNNKTYSDAAIECGGIFGPNIGEGRLLEVTSDAELGMISAEIRARHLGDNLQYWVTSAPKPTNFSESDDLCPALTYEGYPDVSWDNNHLDFRFFACSKPSRFICQKRLGSQEFWSDPSLWGDVQQQQIIKHLMPKGSFIHVFNILLAVLAVVSILCFAVGFGLVAAANRWNWAPITRIVRRGRKHGEVMYLHADSTDES